MAEAATGPASQENLGRRPNFEMHRREDEGKRKVEVEPRAHRWEKETGAKRRWKKHWAEGHRPGKAVGQRLRLQGWREAGREVNRDRERKDRDRTEIKLERETKVQRDMEERQREGWRGG